jgi:hypothetical protein
MLRAMKTERQLYESLRPEQLRAMQTWFALDRRRLADGLAFCDKRLRLIADILRQRRRPK